jgi:IAA-amino acid hydrolase
MLTAVLPMLLCISQSEVLSEILWCPDHPMYPAVVNTERLHSHVENVGISLFCPDKVNHRDKMMAWEDFACYQQLVPGVMIDISITNEDVGSVHSAHNWHFFVDDVVLHVGTVVLTSR